jgi:glutathione S-transferase
MKIFYTPTSPFVRKVLVCAHELGLADRVETVLLRPSPTHADPTLSNENPLNKIPALLRDDGRALYDSPVICEYLDALAGGGKILPRDGDARWDVLRTPGPRRRDPRRVDPGLLRAPAPPAGAALGRLA